MLKTICRSVAVNKLPARTQFLSCIACKWAFIVLNGRAIVAVSVFCYISHLNLVTRLNCLQRKTSANMCDAGLSYITIHCWFHTWWLIDVKGNPVQCWYIRSIQIFSYSSTKLVNLSRSTPCINLDSFNFKENSWYKTLTAPKLQFLFLGMGTVAEFFHIYLISGKCYLLPLYKKVRHL